MQARHRRAPSPQGGRGGRAGRFPLAARPVSPAPEHPRAGLGPTADPGGFASAPSASLEGVEASVAARSQRAGGRTISVSLQEGRERQGRCPPLAAELETTQLARGQPTQHPALAHLKVPGHLRRRQRPVVKHGIGPAVGSTLKREIIENGRSICWHNKFHRPPSELPENPILLFPVEKSITHPQFIHRVERQ